MVDMDDEALEVYQGFNKEPLPEGGRFADLREGKPNNEGYYPVRLLKKIPFADLNESTMRELEESLRDEEDEE